MTDAARQQSALPAEDRGTLVQVLRARARSSPARVAFRFPVRDGFSELTYGQLEDKSRAVAAHLAELLPAGAPVLVMCSNDEDFITAMMGCLAAALIPVPAPPIDARRLQATLPRVHVIARESGATIALCSSDFKPDDIGLPFRCVRIGDALGAAAPACDRDDAVSPDSVAVLQYTSGSTADPRGVVLTHSNILANLDMIQRATRQDASAIGVAWLPLYHDMGLIGDALFPLYAGFPATLMSAMSFLKRPLRWLELISELRATITPAPNFGYELCVRALDRAKGPVRLDLSCLEVALNGAEFVRPSTLTRFSERFERYGFRAECFQACYGLAEAVLMVTSAPYGRGASVRRVRLQTGQLDVAMQSAAPDSRGAVEVVSSGRPLGSTCVLIADMTARVPCADGEVGEILVAGPSVAAGYWRRPADTASVFAVHLADGSGPFLRTGDLGLLHAGELHVVGRVKDLLILDGRNLYPCDIEQTITCAAPALAGERSVILALDDPPSLAILQEVDRGYADKLTLIATVREAVSATHQVSVSAVVLVERGSLPLTSSGKVRRPEAEERFREGQLKVVGQWLRPKFGRHMHDDVESTTSSP